MNRYIITREQIKGQEYLISALYDEHKKMVEVLLEQAEEKNDAALGDIYIARVENVVKNLNAAFVKIGPGQNCYLPLEDLKNPIFTKKLSEKKTLAAGDELLVQISREAIKTKEPAVTTNLSFSGKYAVLTSGNQKMSVSSKLSKDKRAHYMELLKHFTETEDSLQMYPAGIIIRTNAAEAPDEAIVEEICELSKLYEQIAETAKYKTCYSLLYTEPAPYLKHLNDLRQDELAEIVTDDRKIFEAICQKYHIPKENLMTGGSVSVPVVQIETGEGINLRYYEDKVLSLSSLYSVKSSLEDALKERVWLKSGAYLIIQPTEALTVIDVNTGKNIAKKDAQENFLKVNKEAAVEIARQLRLRNISGIIVVDFMNLTSEEAKAELLAVFRAELKKDPVLSQVIDMTKLGLVEVTRKKVRKSLREIL